MTPLLRPGAPLLSSSYTRDEYPEFFWRQVSFDCYGHDRTGFAYSGGIVVIYDGSRDQAAY